MYIHLYPNSCEPLLNGGVSFPQNRDFFCQSMGARLLHEMSMGAMVGVTHHLRITRYSKRFKEY